MKTKQARCHVCNGMGVVVTNTEISSASKTCPNCHGCGFESAPVTNADQIREMDDEELANFLCAIAYRGEQTWREPFAEKFCHHCHEEECRCDDGSKLYLHECDFADGKCPHGSDVMWWLQQPYEGERDE